MTSLAFTGVLFAVRRALEPLVRVERELRSRDPKDLTPLDLEIPREIQTLVSTINRFMDRLSGRIALMQRFIADAAHQIRTPLAGLASQVDLLTRGVKAERREQQLDPCQGANGRTRSPHEPAPEPCDDHPSGRGRRVRDRSISLLLARQTLVNAVPLSLDRDVDISFDEPSGPVLMKGDAVSLREALSNLIHNALKHGAETRLEVRRSCRRGCRGRRGGRRRAGDPGVGMAARPGTLPYARASTGSGLGLAIAGDVVRAHGGELRFRERSEDGFAVIRLRFRLLRAGSEAPSASRASPPACADG